jgi:hypothetical protein
MSRLCLVNKRDVEFVMEKERMANKVTGNNMYLTYLLACIFSQDLNSANIYV